MKLTWLKRKIQACYLHGGFFGFCRVLLLGIGRSGASRRHEHCLYIHTQWEWRNLPDEFRRETSSQTHRAP